MNGEHPNTPAPPSKETIALPCPACGGTAMEARGQAAIGKQTILTGYYWYCFSDGNTPIGTDCEFEGPHCDSSAQALKAWNELPRNAR